jgi:hypothetical protein
MQVHLPNPGLVTDATMASTFFSFEHLLSIPFLLWHRSSSVVQLRVYSASQLW